MVYSTLEQAIKDVKNNFAIEQKLHFLQGKQDKK